MKVNLFKSSSSAGRSKPAVSAHQSIRGRISGPIPIPNPVDDEEFPIRQPGTSFAAMKPPSDDDFPIRRPGATVASPVPPETKEPEQPGETPQEPQANAPGVSGGRTDVGQSSASEPQSNPQPATPASGPSPTSGGGGSGSGASPTQRRTNPPGTLRYSQISAASTGKTGESGRPQRKKSTLRNALSRLFGRRKKTGSQGSNETERMSTLVTSQQHRSDPTALSRAKDNEPKRSNSLPLTEYDRALRSHCVGPDDITAIESARNSMNAELSPGRRRAATTTSRLKGPPRRGELGEWAGLSPRPASAQGRASRVLTMLGDDDPNEIGRAITSDNPGEFMQRRRSRSLSGIQDVENGRTQVRRRSDEIRYWRESYDPGFMSPLSSGNEGDNGDYGDNDDTGAVSLSMPESPAVELPPKTPPQPFNFGSIASMNEMAGMKITQAVSLETRFGSLEARMFKLERIVDQLCHSVPGFKTPLTEFPPETIPRSVPSLDTQPFAFTTAAPPMIPAVYQAITAEAKGSGGSLPYYSSRYSVDTDAHSHMSFGEGQTYIGSLHPPSSSATQAQSIMALSPADRPTSTSTVRGATSLPTLGARPSPPNEPDLLVQIEAERAARQALEVQVRKLSDRVNTLSSTMFAMLRDPAKSRSQERLGAAASTTATTPTGPVSMLVPPPPPKPSSVFEDDSDSEDPKDAKKLPSEFGEETTSEAFETPREEKPFYGAFGEELKAHEDDPNRKKAARTLSLSQLTQGKEGQI